MYEEYRGSIFLCLKCFYTVKDKTYLKKFYIKIYMFVFTSEKGNALK